MALVECGKREFKRPSTGWRHDIDWVHIAAAERWYYRSTVPNSPGVSDRGCCALKATCRLLRPPAVPLWDF
jgi:hypothetical protein